MNSLPGEGVASGEVAEVLEGEDGKERVFGDTDAEGDVEDGAFIEVAQEGLRKDVAGGL